ncbi:MAG: YraN family protein [Oscillospiraceae bacterium]|jgi:putative endonuclease
MNRREAGNVGEAAVCDHLINKGWNIVSRNYTIKGGEVDIIAANGDIIAFIEVKTRDENAVESGFFAVTKAKRLRIIKTAQHYFYHHKCELQPRFDVAAVETKNGKAISVDYIENAFDMSDTHIIF